MGLKSCEAALLISEQDQHKRESFHGIDEILGKLRFRLEFDQVSTFKTYKECCGVFSKKE